MKIAPDRVTRLALVDTNARADTFARRITRHLTNAVVRARSDFRPLVERSIQSLLHPDSPEDVREELVEISLRVGKRAYVRQNRAVTARGDLRGVLSTISVPTAVIVGEQDRLTPPALSREIHGLMQGSSLHVIPECGHLPPIEQPGALATLLRALLVDGDDRPQ